MKPKKHSLIGAIFALILYLIFPQIGIIGAILVFSSTVLIDTDHYLFYLYKTGDWNLKRAFQWFSKSEEKFLSLPRKERDKYYTGFCFLHGIELLLILFLLGRFLSFYFYYILLGVFFHMFLDVIEQIKQNKRIDKLSIIYDFIKFRKLKLFQEEK